MPNEEQRNRLMRGVAEWNAWRLEKPEIKPYLWKCDLRGADLRGANLHDCNLSESNLSGMHLNGADLSYADLSSSNLSGADLSEVNLHGAWLNFADLSGANLKKANLEHTNLLKADLRRANLTSCDLVRANLSWAKLNDANFDSVTMAHTLFVHCSTLIYAQNLDRVKHNATSSLDQSTLHTCFKDLPVQFLKGVGYSDEQLAGIRELLGHP